MGILQPMMKRAAEDGMKGFLEKRGGGRHAPGRRASSWLSGFASWQKRYFVLKNRMLFYYKTKADYEQHKTCKGVINFQ